MRQLLLLRHAKSSWDDPKMSDHARPLNARGRTAAAALRSMFRARGYAPDLVLVSSARRTLQTLEALEPWDETPLIEPVDSLYLATAPQVLAVIAAIPGTVRTALLVGHLPGLQEAALQLADPAGSAQADLGRMRTAYPTAGLAEFSINGTWPELGPDLGPEGARLVRFWTPKGDEDGQPS